MENRELISVYNPGSDRKSYSKIYYYYYLTLLQPSGYTELLTSLAY